MGRRNIYCTFVLYQSTGMIISRKCSWVIQLWAEQATFFMEGGEGVHFSLKNSWQTNYSDFYAFSQKWVKCHFRKTTVFSIVTNDKLCAFKRKLEFWKTCIHICIIQWTNILQIINYVIKSCMGKILIQSIIFKVQNRSMEFNVTVQIINMVSAFTLQLTFKKLPFVDIWCGTKEYP